MTTRRQHSADADEGKPTASGAVPEARPDGSAVSPGIGPVPAIYVSPSGGRSISEMFLDLG